jgi:hypothetical protein
MKKGHTCAEGGWYVSLSAVFQARDGNVFPCSNHNIVPNPHDGTDSHAGNPQLTERKGLPRVGSELPGLPEAPKLLPQVGGDVIALQERLQL